MSGVSGGNTEFGSCGYRELSAPRPVASYSIVNCYQILWDRGHPLSIAAKDYCAFVCEGRDFPNTNSCQFILMQNIQSCWNFGWKSNLPKRFLPHGDLFDGLIKVNATKRIWWAKVKCQLAGESKPAERVTNTGNSGARQHSTDTPNFKCDPFT